MTGIEVDYRQSHIAALKRIYIEYQKPYRESKQIKGLLADFFPCHKMLRNLLYTCIEEGIIDDLIIRSSCSTYDVSRYEKTILNSHGCSTEHADVVIWLWLNALEIAIPNGLDIPVDTYNRIVEEPRPIRRSSSITVNFDLICQGVINDILGLVETMRIDLDLYDDYDYEYLYYYAVEFGYFLVKGISNYTKILEDPFYIKVFSTSYMILKTDCDYVPDRGFMTDNQLSSCHKELRKKYEEALNIAERPKDQVALFTDMFLDIIEINKIRSDTRKEIDKIESKWAELTPKGEIGIIAKYVNECNEFIE